MFFSNIYRTIEKGQLKKLEAMSRRVDFSAFSGKRILDIGSGTCVFERFMKKKNIHAKFVCVESDNVMIEKIPSEIKNDPGIEIVNSTYKKFSYVCEKEFDFVVCMDSLHLISGDITSFLKKSGSVLVSMFFNEMDYRKRMEMVMSSIGNCSVEKEFILGTGEKEIMVLARKN